VYTAEQRKTLRSPNTLAQRFPQGMSGHRTRQPKNLDAGDFQPAITSFALHLRAERKSDKTIRTYTEATQWFAAEYLRQHTAHSDWEYVRREDIEQWMVWLLDRYSDSYSNNQYRALQQFFKWWADDEDLPRCCGRAVAVCPVVAEWLGVFFVCGFAVGWW
jgi:integrase-like protein